MPIRGRSPDQCFSQFENHLRPLIAALLGEQRHIGRAERRENILTLRFSKLTERLDTRYGHLHFYLAQEHEAIEESDSAYRLETKRYWYRLLADPDPKAKALLRWEYDKDTAAHRYPRHHVQGKAVIPESSLDLNKLHVPTGWVLIEEILRFLIVDLEVKPACGKEWTKRLQEGEELFFEKFTSKRFVPPADPANPN